MKRIFLPLLLCCALSATARKNHTGPAKVSLPAVETVEIRDTVRSHLDAVTLSGYDKPNQTVREAFFVTNNHPDSIVIGEINVTLTYFDIKGRMLHEATHSVRCLIDPGKTKRVEIPSWDRNCAFHYYRSQPPKRRQSTPYRVSSRVNFVVK